MDQCTLVVLDEEMFGLVEHFVWWAIMSAQVHNESRQHFGLSGSALVEPPHVVQIAGMLPVKCCNELASKDFGPINDRGRCLSPKLFGSSD